MDSIIWILSFSTIFISSFALRLFRHTTKMNIDNLNATTIMYTHIYTEKCVTSISQYHWSCWAWWFNNPLAKELNIEKYRIILTKFTYK